MAHPFSLPTGPTLLSPHLHDAKPFRSSVWKQCTRFAVQTWARLNQSAPAQYSPLRWANKQMNEWAMLKPNQHMAYPNSYHVSFPQMRVSSLSLSAWLTVVGAVTEGHQMHHHSELRQFRMYGEARWAGRKVDPYWLRDPCHLPCPLSRRIADSHFN